jgi:hypothetical protein
MDAVRALAEAVLYEGYLLWPYRRSAPKNRRRWTFGGVFAPAWTAAHPDDPSVIQAQCLVEGTRRTRLTIVARFLHVVERRVGASAGEGLRWVDQLEVDGVRHLAWEEAAEREIVVPVWSLGELGAPRQTAIDVAAGRVEEPLVDAAGARSGAVVRSWQRLAGHVETAAEELEPGLFRLTARIVNQGQWQGSDRDEALRHAFVSTHLVLRAEGGAFVSLTDPPARRSGAAAACVNRGTWPVLVGEPGERHTLLAAPIILEDHPRIAPESPGDLFDATEIDGMLILNVLTMTPAEQAEMRDCDPRARAILDRCAALTPEQRMTLHEGAIRELRTVSEP